MASSSKETVRRQREIQQQVDERDKAEKAKKATKKAAKKSNGNAKKQAVQAGARDQPENPMPAQHIAKPGNEHELDLAPRYMAPDYAGSGKLEGMAAIVTGGDSGIGRSVAVLYAREGADVAVVYLSRQRRPSSSTARLVSSASACSLR